MNHAHIGNLVFERDDGESVPDFRAHVRAAAAELGGGVLAWGAPEELEWVDAEVETIVVTGGISEDASGDIAQFSVLIERQDGESVEAFRARARETAIAAGAGFVTFGGLPPMPTDHSISEVQTEQPKGE